jgi:hypothetical protein
MDTILVSSNTKGDTEQLLKFIGSMGLRSKLLSSNEKEAFALLAAMLEADRSEIEDESIVINKLKEKCK